ncbi:Heavy-metal-associated domain (N-terminus) and membrane-bounded cytochrome biogeneis cycZ-like domain protein [Arcticibacter svalbardensis MN12-7]|uniref:Heavy-metal-associated domain (N-terminus) and membrane-bounded cytochrome biogeneis cycZ-like domain protein n=2 Tax=Arcticibacter TaxID=1288026 RepID=R9GTY9_9SPHI|nr:Heavy-metal-associated domain (N-terminus) and membrane-bounded cytochrome biogeneis cycZ-like domain protein [Arcticibacter svalbardensis MN12-7]
MCGPLAFAIPSKHANRWLVLLDKLIYQVGRIISYSILGIIIGVLGKQLWLSGLQQSVSILSGIFIILAALSQLNKRHFLRNQSSVVIKYYNKLFSYALQHKANHLITGVLNGFLPCGFVYLALAGAVNTGNVIDSALYMALFGLGTLPLMLIATFGMGMVGSFFKQKINRVVPYFMICLGLWFILRGSELSIPYLSPAAVDNTEVCE